MNTYKIESVDGDVSRVDASYYEFVEGFAFFYKQVSWESEDGRTGGAQEVCVLAKALHTIDSVALVSE